LRFEKNHGKGFAVKQGLLKARGDIALFLDADGSTPVTEIERHIHYFNENYDIVIGSRVLKDAHSTVEALSYRKWMGTIFNSCIRLFLIKNIKDTQCGFKILSLLYLMKCA
jgi:dolichyl-phosphate beta-glucosyltransferase